MEEKLRTIIAAHNRMIETIEGAEITCNLFRGMEVWNKIACEGAEIASAARSIGIDAKVSTQAGKISVPLVENNTRFTEGEVFHAEHRTGLTRAEVLRILTECDVGIGDVDDVLDRWEEVTEQHEPNLMSLAEIIISLEDQACDKDDFVDEDDPDCIFRRDVAALRAAAKLIRKMEAQNDC